MTQKQRDNNLSDELNPRYLFSLTATDLLTKIIAGEIDAVELAKKELDSRRLRHVRNKSLKEVEKVGLILQ